jgi:hypothetical protein
MVGNGHQGLAQSFTRYLIRPLYKFSYECRLVTVNHERAAQISGFNIEVPENRTLSLLAADIRQGRAGGGGSNTSLGLNDRDDAAGPNSSTRAELLVDTHQLLNYVQQ